MSTDEILLFQSKRLYNNRKVIKQLLKYTDESVVDRVGRDEEGGLGKQGNI